MSAISELEQQRLHDEMGELGSRFGIHFESPVKEKSKPDVDINQQPVGDGEVKIAGIQHSPHFQWLEERQNRREASPEPEVVNKRRMLNDKDFFPIRNEVKLEEFLREPHPEVVAIFLSLPGLVKFLILKEIIEKHPNLRAIRVPHSCEESIIGIKDQLGPSACERVRITAKTYGK